MILDIESLIDKDELSKSIWNYWISICKSDRVISDDEMPLWDDMDDTLKTRFIETIYTKISYPIETNRKKFDLTAQPVPSGEYACYICMLNSVYSPGKACTRCRNEFAVVDAQRGIY